MIISRLIDKNFSEYEDEKLYSVLMDEEELRLYSEFLEEKIFFFDTAGEPFTGKQLIEATNREMTGLRNGEIKTVNSKGQVISNLKPNKGESMVASYVKLRTKPHWAKKLPEAELKKISKNIEGVKVKDGEIVGFIPKIKDGVVKSKAGKKGIKGIIPNLKKLLRK